MVAQQPRSSSSSSHFLAMSSMLDYVDPKEEEEEYIKPFMLKKGVNGLEETATWDDMIIK